MAGLRIGVRIKTPINIDGVKRGVRQRYVNYAERLFNKCVELSPVDTGSFRASWQISYGAPKTGVTYGGSSDAPLMPPSFPGVPTRFKLGDVLYVSNSMPYARRLEEGWSKQAPHGIVKMARLSVSP